MDRRTKTILIVSLTANLFLVGALIGTLILGSRLAHERTEARRGDRPGVWSAMQSIPPERQRVLRQMMREQAMRAAPDLRAAREARRAAARLIAAPSYDPAAVEAALRRARDHDLQARAKVDAALAVRLGELTAQERAAFGQVMLRGPRGGRGRRDGSRGGPPPPGGPERSSASSPSR